MQRDEIEPSKGKRKLRLDPWWPLSPHNVFVPLFKVCTLLMMQKKPLLSLQNVRLFFF